jgi:hypothetical protein
MTINYMCIVIIVTQIKLTKILTLSLTITPETRVGGWVVGAAAMDQISVVPELLV